MTALMLRAHLPRRVPATTARSAPVTRLGVSLRVRLPGAVAAPHHCPVGSCPAVIGAGRLVCRAHRRHLPRPVPRDLRRARAVGGPGSPAWLAAVLAALQAAEAAR